MKRILKIVLTIVAAGLLASFVYLFFFGHTCTGGNTATARNEASVLRSASMLFIAQMKKCPSIRELKGRYLDEHRRTSDPWGTEYKILCGNAHENLDRITVVSAGKDGKFNTGDDILVPSPDE